MKKEKQGDVDLSEMNDNQMWDLLIELHGSPFWESIVKFNRKVESQIYGTLLSKDPFTQPVDVARTQGLRMGINKLGDDILKEISRREDDSKSNEKK
jgi:hypothetical protein